MTPITIEGLSTRLDQLDDIGVGPDGVNRLAWTDEDSACRAWFERQAAQAGLAVARDPAGNLWACPDSDPPWWAAGSHLDSVRGGGRFDGPLGVACAFEIAAGGSAPIAVISFADEEGARFNTPTFGSKALTGRLDLPVVLARRDADGTPLAEAMRLAGVDPDRIADARTWLGRLAGFIEVHIDQTTELARRGEPVGVVSSLAARLRLEATLRGQADHAGTTPRGERRDALATAARLIVGAEELADGDHGLTVTTSRILAQPNAPTTIAAEVRLWIDARAPRPAQVDEWLHGLRALAARLAESSGVDIGLEVASRTGSSEFSERVRSELGRSSEMLLERRAPELVCYAGHDAGVLAERIPAAMLLVRNPTGISHSPRETVDLEDAVIAARVAEGALRTVSSVAA